MDMNFNKHNSNHNALDIEEDKSQDFDMQSNSPMSLSKKLKLSPRGLEKSGSVMDFEVASAGGRSNFTTSTFRKKNQKLGLASALSSSSMYGTVSTPALFNASD